MSSSPSPSDALASSFSHFEQKRGTRMKIAQLQSKMASMGSERAASEASLSELQPQAQGSGSHLVRTKSKLASIHDKISGFEKQMESETKQRKATEEGRLNGIRESISKMEKTLNAEIKRRVEANKTLQSVSAFNKVKYAF
eukprot:GHVU01158993.1.p1 GENE.GHVU01158993.1~~GHVU01158993.1.p1  ORF type:complete len:141 (-),score=18.55 GHVU01158993.1:156-578(-)